jgi:lipopolysaccharide assembly outer membrane protein LptD (OstA)
MMLCLLLLLSQEGGSTALQQDSSRVDSVSIIHYSAQQITYDLERSLIILRDSSKISYQDITLLSDSAYYYIETNNLEAFGTCDLRQMEDSIRGSYLRYNIDTKKAVMSGGVTQIDKGLLTGEEIYWVDEKTINAYNGIYTTCTDTPPHYYFYAPRMKVYIGDMVITRPIVLFVEGYPVAAAPFWFVPISSKRKSGLLPFRAGNSSAYGKYIKGLAYYLVLSDYADVTFQLDAMEKKGAMPHAEAVWDFTPFSKGSIYGSYIREIDTKTERYTIKARNNSPYFLWGSQFNCDIKYVSDRAYEQDYADTILLRLEREITSQATLTRNIMGVKNTVSLERHERYQDSSITEKLPFYSMTMPARMLFSLLSYSVSGHFNRLRANTPDEQSDVWGTNLQTAPQLQQNVFNLFTVSPQAVLDYALFSADTADNPYPQRFAYSLGVTATTNLYRVYGIGVAGIQGVLHKILPRVSFTYTPDFDVGALPVISGIPSFSRAQSIGFGIDQTVEAKIGEDNKHTLLRMGLGSSYSLLTDSLSSITFNAELPYNPLPAPFSRFSSQITGSLDPYSGDYRYTLSNTTALQLEFLTLTVNQSYTRDGAYQIWFNGDLKPSDHWNISYSARYDRNTHAFVDYSFSVKRDLHCWQAVLNFDQLGDIWRYDFKVYIKDIPDVQIGKGLLGSFLE